MDNGSKKKDGHERGLTEIDIKTTLAKGISNELNKHSGATTEVQRMNTEESEKVELNKDKIKDKIAESI